MNKLLIIIVFIIIPLLSYSQGSSSHNAPYATPSFFSVPSPTAASLGKFGFTQVANYSGLPQVAIPLWEAKGNQLSLPIALNYNNNGLKVTEEASWVGLGWSLQAGGTITQDVRGFPDPIDGPNTQVVPYGDITSKTSQLQFNLVGQRLADGSPDFFIFNFGQYSGKFFFYRDTIHQFTYSDLKIAYDRPSHSFTVVAGDGTTYRFAQRETTQSTVSINSSPAAYAWTSPYIYSYTWLLTQIVSADGQDIISLTYASTVETILDPDFLRKSQSFQVNIPQISDIECQYWPVSPFINTTASSTTTTSYRLQRIDTRRERIDFLAAAQPRADINGTAYALAQIDIRDKSLPDTAAIKSFHFATSFFGTGTPTPRLNRLRLDSVYEAGTNQAVNPPYRFRYYYQNQAFPDKAGYAMDHWGYHNGKYNVNLIPTTTHQSVGTADRNPDFSSALIGVLSTITYPTRGSESFVYEQNQYLDATGGLQIGPGLRVRTVAAHDKQGGLSYRAFQYKPLSLPGLNTGYESITTANPGTRCDCMVAEINSTNPDVYSIFGSSVYYDTVTELSGLNGENGSTTYSYQSIGLPQWSNGMNLVKKVVRQADKRKLSEENYTYSLVNDLNLSVILNTNVEYNDYSAGSRSAGGSVGGIHGTVQTTTGFVYSTNGSTALTTIYEPNYRIPIMLYYYSFSYLSSSWNRLTRKSSTHFAADTTQSFTKQFAYFYDYGTLPQTNTHFHRYVTREEVVRDENALNPSQRKTDITLTHYLPEYLLFSSLGNDPFFNALKRMQDLHIINQPIETLSEVRTGSTTGTTQVVGGQLTLFKEFYPGIIKPASLLALGTTTPLATSSSFSYPTTISTYYWDNHYVPRVQYAYNAVGQLVDWQKSQLQYSAIWDATGTQLLAKVQNAESSTCAFSSFEAGAKGGFIYSDYYCVPGGRTGQRAYKLYQGRGVSSPGLAAGEYELLLWVQGSV